MPVIFINRYGFRGGPRVRAGLLHVLEGAMACLSPAILSSRAGRSHFKVIFNFIELLGRSRVRSPRMLVAIALLARLSPFLGPRLPESKPSPLGDLRDMAYEWGIEYDLKRRNLRIPGRNPRAHLLLTASSFLCSPRMAHTGNIRKAWTWPSYMASQVLEPTMLSLLWDQFPSRSRKISTTWV